MSSRRENPKDQLASDSKLIKATRFDAPSVSTMKPEESDYDINHQPIKGGIAFHEKNSIRHSKWWHSQFNLMLAVFGLLVLTAILFVVIVPSPEVNKADLISATQNATPALADSEAPWSQSQRAQARSESQTILANLLDSKKSLENKNVLEWAPEQYQTALDVAATGDELYQLNEYVAAIKEYQSAVEQMDGLYSLLPKLIATLLAEGRDAIDKGKSVLAVEKFNRVLVLDETNLDATLGLDRATKLDQVLEIIALAESHVIDFQQSGDVDDLYDAEEKLQKAKNIDEYFKPIDIALIKVKSEIIDRKFQLEMTKAYQSLFAKNYAKARLAFAKALKIKPDDTSAVMAQRQALASDVSSSIASLLTRAKAYEQQEEWASAYNNYQSVLQRDVNQVSAKFGEIRTGARKKLDSNIRVMLNDTLSFSRAEIKNQATLVLKDAKAIRSKGNKLLKQITQLEYALSKSMESIKVTLLSDSHTEISFQKLGSKSIKLGIFSKKNMALKPGRYIARGVRLGYKDLLAEIEIISNKQAIQTITLVCDEPLRSLTKG